MPTTVTHTIDPTGGADYTTVDAWNVAQRRNLVSLDEVARAEVRGGGNAGNPSARTLINSGWTTDATRRLELVAAAGHRHEGKWDTAFAYIESTLTIHPVAVLQISSYDTYIEGMQIKGKPNGNSYTVWNQNAGLDLEGCIIIREMDEGYLSSAGGMVQIRNPEIDCNITNSILIDDSYRNAGASCVQFQFDALGAKTCNVFNCTLIQLNTLLNTCYVLECANGHTIVSQNNYLANIQGTQPVYKETGTGTITKGANDATNTTEATTPALQSVAYDATTFTAVTDRAEDLSLPSGSPLIDAGADLSGSGVTTDAVELVRPKGAAYDIGALEANIFLPFVKEVDATLGTLLEADMALATLSESDSTLGTLYDADATLGLKE